MPVAVAPPGRSRLTVTGVSARSAAITRDSASTAAPDGPYGTNPRRVIVCSLIEMVTIRPPPAATIRGATARATRNAPVTFVSTTSRKPSGVTSQNGCGVGEEARVDGAHPDAGVVDEHVESAEPFPDLVDDRVDRCFVADVELHAHGVGPEPLGGGLRPGQLAARHHDAAPAALNAAAIAAPRPLDAPVTITRVPASSLTSTRLSVGRRDVAEAFTA